MDEKVEYWLELSDYDLETAKVMLIGKRYLYVGFMCHQAIEKSLKAYYQFTKNEIPPKIHNLLFLADNTGLLVLMTEEQIDFLTKISPLNIESRYPEYKEKISKILDKKTSKNLLEKTGALQKWIKEKL
ncbi:MAG: HEPN domain-containing protein [bacterium]